MWILTMMIFSLRPNAPVCGETVGYYQGDYDEPVEVLCPNCDAVVAVIGKDDDYEEVEDDEIVIEDELDED